MRVEAAPSITNQVAAQRPGTNLVDIVYDLAAPGFPTVAVTLEASSDGGTTWTVPVSSVSGAVGTDVEPGTGKSVVWNAGADWPEGYSSRMRVRVIVDDGYVAIPSEDDEEALPPHIWESTQAINYPLQSGQTYAVGLKLADILSRETALLDGTLTLALVTSAMEPVEFAYTLSSATLPLVQGIASGMVTITTSGDLTDVYLAVIDFQQGPESSVPEGRLGEVASAESAPTKPDPRVVGNLLKKLEDYQSTLPWDGLTHPLPDPAGNYPISGSFGEWRASTTSRGGRAHKGLDFAASHSTVVRAVSSGVVCWRSNLDTKDRQGNPVNLGELVVINHGNGYCTRYLHIDPCVDVDQLVAAGRKIGTVADIAADHLHFEIRENCALYYHPEQPGRNGAPYATGQQDTLGPQVNPLTFNLNFTPTLVHGQNDATEPRIRGLNFFGASPRPSRRYYTPASASGILANGQRADTELVVEVVDGEGDSVLVPRSLTVTESKLDDSAPPRELGRIAFEEDSGVKPLFPPFPEGVSQGYPYVNLRYLRRTAPRNGELEKFDCYPFWFKWDTTGYANTPDGPRKLTFTATDWMERTAEHVASFGPQFPESVPPSSVPEDPAGLTFEVKIKAHLGPFPDGMNGAAKDRLALSFRTEPKDGFAYEALWMPSGSAEKAEIAVDFAGTNFSTPSVEKTLQVRVRLKAGTEMPQEPQTLVLLAKSGNFPNLAHELEVELGPSTCEPQPLDGTPPAAPAGFSLIPGGPFTMGRTSGDTDSDAPPVTVTVSPFYIQQTETTKAQWDEVRIWGAANRYTDLPTGGGKASDHPVQTVSWYDVVKWCNARSEKEDLSPCYYTGPERRADQIYRTGTVANLTVCWGANGYRLPTEAEWEKAARGGVSGKRFPWGTDTISHAQANYYGSSSYAYDQSPINNYHPSYTAGGTPYTSPVGSFGANPFGLYDMSGNVLEWCWDWYGGASSYVNGATDPRGASSGSFRVARGGGWGASAFEARCADRIIGSPVNRFNCFRPARSSVP
jgi:formylglycine-generating enzyme required for sulfatase activity/murein DD-endopeptidase MepM/ murein hydrolase activator NlpD